MPTPEQQLQKQLQQAREALELSSQNDTPQSAPHLEQAKKLESELKENIQKLREKLWPFATELPGKELAEQYSEQKEIQAQNKLLEPLSNGELGIVGIDQKAYPFPTLEQIKKELSKDKELKIKMEQGLIRLGIAPFALPIAKLIQAVEQAIKKHYVGMPDPQDPTKRIADPQKTKLFATKRDLNDPNEPLIPLELDENQPLWVWDKYQNADTDGTLVYFSKQFDQTNHQGRTKQEILQIQTAFPGYLVTLQEVNPNIPRENQGQTKNNRKQLETNKTPSEYLQKLQTDPQYQKESGATPEEWLMRFLTHLEKTNQVVDDYQGNGSAAYNLAGYFPASGSVSSAFWCRVYRQAYLGGLGASNQYSYYGARSAVRVGLEI
jgi:hypothetical protein